MNAIFNGKLKYFFLAPIALLIIFAMLDLNALTDVRKWLLEEKKIEKKATIDQLVNMIDKFVELDNDWNEYDYRTIINIVIAETDGEQDVFAAIYNEDLEVISDRIYEPSQNMFDPTQASDFREAVYINENAWIKLSYNKGRKTIDMNVYYRWVPNTSYDNRYLLAVGVSTESVVVNPAGHLAVRMVIQLLVTFIMNLIFVMLLTYLGRIYTSRNGTKWRPSD
ncbi:MAG: hypothetical protein LBB94_10250 [Clostridiales bacterium]|jgi:hypothetical protein|nr:hypothetical protein [Clostridiales bacterium]